MKLRPPALRLGYVAALALVALPALAAAQIKRLEVMPLANDTVLAPQDVTVLDSLVLSLLSALPQERHEVVAGTASADPACDTACRLSAARSRGASRVVVGRIASFGGGFVGTLELYDAATGQLLESASTDTAMDAPALLAGVKQAALQLRRRIEPDAPAPTAPATPPAAIPSTAPPVGGAPVTATLRVETTPPGADISITRLGQTNPAGQSPVEKVLLPVEYRVTARMKDHKDAEAEVRLDPFATKTLRLTLRRIYPMAASKKWGHAAFWSGLGIALFGTVATAVASVKAYYYNQSLDEDAKRASENWAGVMWASFGVGAALMTTGVILWAATPSSKEQWEEVHGRIAVAPTPDGGFVAGYGRGF